MFAHCIEFQIAPSNSTIARGGPVTFYCQVATSSSISLSWRHNGITVIPNNCTQQSVLPNGTLQLTVDPTMDGDDGNYSCVATVRFTLEEHIRTAYLQFACKPIIANYGSIASYFTVNEISGGRIFIINFIAIYLPVHLSIMV